MAQNITKFDRLHLNNGFLQSIVYKIDSDTYGNIWLATEEGVIRYNSKEAYLYNKFNGLPDGVGNRVTTLLCNGNDIWIGTENGICHYNPKSDSFVKIENENKEICNVVKIAKDSKNNFWVSTYNGLWKYSLKDGIYFGNKIINSINAKSMGFFDDKLIYSIKKEAFIIDVTTEMATKLKPLDFDVNDISVIKKINQNLFIGLNNGELYLSDLLFGNVTKIKIPIELKNIVIKDFESYLNTIIIATDGAGIIELDLKLNFLKQYKHSEDNFGTLSINGVYDLYVDKQNILWIATYGGNVNLFDPQKSYFENFSHITNTQNSISNSFTRSFLELDNGNVLVGTIDGLNLWNKDTNTWRKLNVLNVENEVILSMAKDGNDIWISAYGNGIYKLNALNYSSQKFELPLDVKNLSTKAIYKILVDNDGSKWFGGIEGNLFRLNKMGEIKSFPIIIVKDIIQSKNGNIIVASKNGIFTIDKRGNFHEIEELKAQKNHLEYTNINSIYESENGTIIIGTNGFGAVFYQPNMKKITVLNDQKLPSDIVQGIVEYRPNNFWISTTRGLSNILINQKDTIVKNYNRLDGLPGDEFNYNAHYKLKNGDLIFGSRVGFTIFNPKNILEPKQLPQIIFEELFINNELIKAGEEPLVHHLNTIEKLKIKYSQNTFGIKFVGILNGYQSKIKYSWMLEGYDENWSKPESRTQVNYAKISYGTYLFKVKATLDGKNWTPERTLQIVVKRPWWASFWAILLYLAILTTIFYTIYKISKLQEFKKNKEEQINMLNNITHEIKTPLTILISTLKDNNHPETKNGTIGNTIERLNGLINQMINFHLVTSSSKPNEEIFKIKISDYISEIIDNFKPLLEEKKLKIEVHNKFVKDIFYWNKSDLDKIILNLISNAVKYSNENGVVSVKINENSKKGTLLIEVIDNGIGIPEEQQKYILKNYYRARNVENSKYSGTGLGLMIVKKIIEKNGGEISFESVENKGTTFMLELPNKEHLYNEEALIRSNKDNELILDEHYDLEKFQNYKILIVEDNEILRHNIVSSLENYFLVYQAVDGKQGLEMAMQIFPDLILTDFIMPVMDGLEMCNQIKNNISLNHIPVFMMTVLHSTEHKEESFEFGVTEYIEKPINLKILFSKISNILKWRENLREKFILQKDIHEVEINRAQKDTDFIEKLEKIILNNIIKEEFNIHDICTELGMSRTSLYMKLKNLLNLSIQEFIIYTRLKFAKNLMIKGENRIKEIAYASGFSNPKHFSTSFRKAFGKTPTEFLKDLN
jgi:signal transduction histidine kinase/AraC-like DNA-binding protein/streptogramin lyase